MPNSAPPREAVSVIAQEFLVDEPCAITVDLPGAHAHLRPGPEEDRVEVDVSVEGCSPDEAETVLDRMELGTQQMTDTVQVYGDGAPPDARWWRWTRTLDVTIHVHLRLPSHVEAEIRVPGGEIDVAGLRGHLDLKPMGGPCRAENLEGTLDIQAESSDVSIIGFSGEQIMSEVIVGSLTMEDIQAETVTARSVAAPLRLSSVTGAADVSARSAPVDLEDINGPCTAEVEGGDLTFDGSPDEEIDLHVVGTSLDALLPSDHGAALTMHGPTLSLDDAFSFEGEREAKKIEGTLNGGGPSLRLRATGGSIRCQPQSE